MGVEGDGYDLVLVTSECVQEGAGLCIPKFCGFVEGAGCDAITRLDRLVPVRNIECHTIHRILMPLKRMQKPPTFRIPNLTSSIIASRNKLISIFIKPTISQR